MLEIQNITFGYQADRPVIHEFTGSLERGKVCALIGPNAVGKSTLLALMMGQLTPWSGRVLMEGNAVESIAPVRRAQWMSYVPQRATASFAFTVREVVEMGRYALTRNPLAVEEALKVCDLGELADTVYARLSVGQQQRVMLARALTQSSGQGRYMLLDEPGSAMDLWHTHRTMQLLRRLALSEGASLGVMVVLHDLNLAGRYADEIWLMHEGRLVAKGPWEQVLRPEILEPVYQVKLTSLSSGEHQRPIFDVSLAQKA